MANNITDYAILQEEDEEQYQKLKAEMEKGKPLKTEKDYINDYLALINKPIPAAWLKDNKVSGGRTIKYLPIYRLEYILTRVYGAFWKREILAEGVMLNSSFARVRVHYKIPGTNIWLFQDGAGASPIQIDATDDPQDSYRKADQKKGNPTRASQLEYLKSTGVQQAYPSAASYAFSNAAERIGRLFGAGLNKEDAFFYTEHYDPDATAPAAPQAPTNTLPKADAPPPPPPKSTPPVAKPEPQAQTIHVEMPNTNSQPNGSVAQQLQQGEFKLEF